MSGGALDYAYMRVHTAASEILVQSDSPLHAAFAEHLLKVSEALRAVEWVLSGDKGEGDDAEAINSCIKP